MKTVFATFSNDRRGAVAMIFALTLLPLVLMIALAIDFSFFTEARSQVQLAADAAATHAIRAAAGTYSLETSEGVLVATATQDAINAGETAGDNWFQAQLGLLPTAYVRQGATANSNPNVLVCSTALVTATCPASNSNGAGFTATVTYDGLYPPLFDRLFNSTSNWNIAGTSSAAAQYSYVEILLMIDTSASMLIGGTATDIADMEQSTVCLPQLAVTSVDGDAPLYYNSGGHDIETYVTWPSDNDTLPGGWQAVYNFTPATTGDGSLGKCNTDFQQAAFAPSTNTNSPNYYNPGYAGTPCAFACHNTTNKYNGNYTDLYGWARSLGRTLRLDQVISSTEQVIQSMIDNEQTADQFSVGVYQFNRTEGPLIPNSGSTQGTVGDPGDSTNDPSTEASYNLPYVLNEVNSVDYWKNSTETVLPPLITSSDDDGDTNFYGSMEQFLSGLSNKSTSGTPGQTASNPVKNIFIITDGMEDECGTCGTPAYGSIGKGARVMGEMTGIQAEISSAAGTQNATEGGLSAVCSLLKDKGFTVYVLYIDYLPVANDSFYYTPPFSSPADTFTTQDYPSISSASSTEQEMADAPMSGPFLYSTAGYTPPTSATVLPNAGFSTADSTNESALRACAYDANTGESNLYIATDNSTSVAQEMQDMLASALSGAITITN